MKNKKYYINFNSQRRERLHNISDCVSHRIFNSVNIATFSVWRTTLPVCKGVMDNLKNNLGEKRFNEKNVETQMSKELWKQVLYNEKY